MPQLKRASIIHRIDAAISQLTLVVVLLLLLLPRVHVCVCLERELDGEDDSDGGQDSAPGEGNLSLNQKKIVSFLFFCETNCYFDFLANLLTRTKSVLLFEIAWVLICSPVLIRVF